MTTNIASLLEKASSYHSKDIDLSLDRMSLLMESLGNPHKRLPPTIHIAGTNGKGSTLAIMKACLQAAGYTVHTYTSPHLVCFNERIHLAGSPISDDYLQICLQTVFDHLDKGLSASFFELTTAVAFLAFSQISADFLLLETGLGGRLDATNIVEPPLATVITSISYDHQDFLGSTLEEITQEKLGIIKPNTPLIIAPQTPVVERYIREKTQDLDQDILQHNHHWTYSLTSDGFILHHKGDHFFPRPCLAGEHQVQNAATALMALKSLNLPQKALEAGLQSAYWPGRLYPIPHTTLILDGAHNVGGTTAMAAYIRQTAQPDEKIRIGVSILANRSIVDILAPLQDVTDDFFHIQCDEAAFHPFSAYPSFVKESVSIEELIKRSKKNEKSTRIFVTGSLYLIGAILKTTQ